MAWTSLRRIFLIGPNYPKDINKDLLMQIFVTRIRYCDGRPANIYLYTSQFANDSAATCIIIYKSVVEVGKPSINICIFFPLPQYTFVSLSLSSSPSISYPLTFSIYVHLFLFVYPSPYLPRPFSGILSPLVFFSLPASLSLYIILSISIFYILVTLAL
jgi:hypothetical protein